jgi:hypothetical protein
MIGVLYGCWRAFVIDIWLIPYVPFHRVSSRHISLLILPPRQEPNADPDQTDINKITLNRDETIKRSLDSFETVLRHGRKIILDHWIVYYTRASLANLLFCFRLRDFVLFRLRAR